MNHSLRGFFQKRLIQPIVVQLKQGTSPKTLALSSSLAITISLFPLLGTTSVLCGLVGALCKLNHPTMQILNQLMTPLQLIGIPIFLHTGETIFHLNHVSFNPLKLGDELISDPRGFFAHYGMSALAGIFVWACVAPVIAFLLYHPARLLLRKLSTPKKDHL